MQPMGEIDCLVIRIADLRSFCSKCSQMCLLSVKLSNQMFFSPQDYRFGALCSSGSAVPDTRQNGHARVV